MEQRKELVAHLDDNVWNEAARGACEGCQKNPTREQSPQHLPGSAGHVLPAQSCKIWHSSGKARPIHWSFWHLLLRVLSSFNKNKACFACRASWLSLVTALVKHKELLDKKELQLKTFKNVRKFSVVSEAWWSLGATLNTHLSRSSQAPTLLFLLISLFLFILQLQKRSGYIKKKRGGGEGREVTGVRLSSYG